MSVRSNWYPLPRDGMSDDVAGGSGDGRDDRSPRAAQTIEQRRLTDIRATDQHDLTKASRHDFLYITTSKGLRGDKRAMHSAADKYIHTKHLSV